MAIFINFSLTSNHLHPLQVENCDSNSRLVVDEDERIKYSNIFIYMYTRYQLEIIINVLALSASFEELCYVMGLRP